MELNFCWNYDCYLIIPRERSFQKKIYMCVCVCNRHRENRSCQPAVSCLVVSFSKMSREKLLPFDFLLRSQSFRLPSKDESWLKKLRVIESVSWRVARCPKNDVSKRVAVTSWIHSRANPVHICRYNVFNIMLNLFRQSVFIEQLSFETRVQSAL